MYQWLLPSWPERTESPQSRDKRSEGGPSPGSEALQGLRGSGHAAALQPGPRCPRPRPHPSLRAVGHLRAALGTARLGVLSEPTHLGAQEPQGARSEKHPGTEACFAGPSHPHPHSKRLGKDPLPPTGSFKDIPPHPHPGPSLFQAARILTQRLEWGGGPGGTREHPLGCSGSEPRTRRLLPVSCPQPQS